jgi:ribose 5-phosphate isomerase A
VNNLQADLKRSAAETAVLQVRSGMVIGLGFGSTAIFALRRIGEMIQSGELRDVVGIPTAESIARDAVAAGIPLTTLEDHPKIDLTIDGADEVDPDLNLIKGGGGALLREKIVAQASQQLIIVVDSSKLSERLGANFKLPVEVLPFGWGSQAKFLEEQGAEVERRRSQEGTQFLTDSGNFILDCDFGEIQDAFALAKRLEQRAGIVEHGLFLDLADEVIIARADGVQSIRRKHK